jgi:hypothetical protein
MRLEFSSFRERLTLSIQVLKMVPNTPNASYMYRRRLRYEAARCSALSEQDSKIVGVARHGWASHSRVALFVFYGEPHMKYTGVHENDRIARG